MKKRVITFAALMAFILAPVMSQKSFYDFTVETIDGQQFSFADLKGKKVIIVNTASKCGNTPQYKDLELLNKAYKQKVVIIGFPANNFMGQEPGTNAEIKEFCDSKYGITFR
jgi:glutathione peroxidase